MNGNRRWFLALITALVLGCLTLPISAQGTTSGTIVMGQPLPSQLDAGTTATYDYTVAQLSQITLQALGASAQPTLTILRDGAVVASQPNSEKALTINLTTTLDAGSYTVEVGTLDNAAGLVVVVLQSEIAVSSTPLVPANIISSVVSNSAPTALYSFSAIDTLDTYLYIESGAENNGVSVQVLNKTSGKLSAQIEASMLGARLHIPAGQDSYQVEIQQSATGSTEPFTICFAPVSVGGCETGSAQSQAAPTAVPPAATEEIFAVPTVASGYCILTGSAKSAVNIRQSATTNSIIVATLPDGASANVIGISPDKQFYNVLYAGTNGWIAVSVASTSGDCANILIINPPPPVLPAAAPTAVPQAAPTSAGPCRLSVVAPTYIYTKTNPIPDYLFDQAQPGAQISPLGRLADNSWWQVLEYGYPQWLQTSTFGNSVQVSGDCSALPIVTP